jgi:CRISPR-associated protein Csc3
MIHQQLLRRAVAGRDPALVDFVETLAPRLLERFATIPALGGSGQQAAISDPCLPDRLARYRDEELERFSHNFDQSLTAHILNGLFAGMRMAEELPPGKALSDIEKRLWVMGYIVHDYTKVYGVKVDAGQLDAIRQVVRCLGKDLGFDAYLPGWLDYLDDVVFLAQNTQKVQGANLNLRDYHLRTRLRRLEKMRMLCSYADVLVHIRTPSEVMLPGSDGRNRAVNLGKTLDDLFGAGQAPRLAYHKLTEVRGLLSNLVNNAVMAELKAQGYQPYLFFPDGVVYLAAPGLQASVDPAAIAETVWERVVDIISESENFGIKPWTTGFLVSSALYTIAGLSGVLDAGRRRAMRLTSNKSPARLYGFFTGKSENDLKKLFGGDMEQVKAEQETVVTAQDIPADGRVHKLGEFLTMVYREVRKKYKKAPDISPLLLKTLAIDDLVTSEETKQQKGGTYFGWFYAASRFIQANPGLDENGIDDTMQRLSRQVLIWVEEQDLKAKDSAALKDTVCKYVSGLIVVDGSQPGAAIDVKASFAQELDRYTKAKAERRPQCSLCSTPFDAVFQEATEMPFINQQYSNKSPLSVPMLVRGVCPVCRVEMILRLVQQEGATEGNRPINLYLYPTYFFTLETERVAKSFVIEMRDLDVFALRQHLRDEGFSLNAFLRYEDFLGDETMQRRGVRPPRYREGEFAGLIFTSLTPLGRKPTDTDAWIIPALLAVGIPLLLDVKLVASPSFVPLFPSGADFHETVILDGPHTFTQHVWGTDRFRVNEVEQALIRLLELYDLHLDVFSERRKPHWAQINAIVKDIVTDPYYVFSYYERKERSQRAKKRKGKKGGKQSSFKGISPQDIERYMEIYYTLGGETDMGIIGKLVDAYAAFYRVDWKKLDSAYGVLRPLGTALDVVVESDPRTDRDDLILLVAGSVNDDQGRVRENQAEGFDPVVTNKSLGSYPERLALSRQRIEEFATICVDDLFAGYCRGDRAILRERTNRLRSAARFYYLRNYGYQK